MTVALHGGGNSRDGVGATSLGSIRISTSWRLFSAQVHVLPWLPAHLLSGIISGAYHHLPPTSSSSLVLLSTFVALAYVFHHRLLGPSSLGNLLPFISDICTRLAVRHLCFMSAIFVYFH